MTHHCPLCGLRFSFATQLDYHAREDHRLVEKDERLERITRYKVSGRPIPGPVYVPL